MNASLVRTWEIAKTVVAVLVLTLYLTRGDATSQTPQTIRVIGPANDGYKSVYYGIKAGIFRKYGLDVEPTIINSGSAAAAALIGGSADVGYTNILAILQAHDRGIQMQILVPAAWYFSDKPTGGMIVLKDSPLRSARDLNGKTIGSLALGDTLSTSILAWIDQNSGDSKTVKIVEAPASSMVAMLEAGRVDASAAIEPSISQAVATGKVRVLGRPLDAFGKQFQAAGYAVMQPVVAQNEDKFSRFARAMRESQAYTNTHPAETVDLVASYSGLAPDVISHSIRNLDPEYVEARNVQPVIDIFAKYGVISHTFPASEIISNAAVKH